MVNRFTEAQLCMWFGGGMGSDIPGRYVHLSGRDIDIEYARLHGIVDEEAPKESKLTPKPCPRCKEKLPPIAKYCYRCGMTLDLQLAMEVQNAQQIETEIQQEALKAILSGQPVGIEMLADIVAERVTKKNKKAD